MSLFRYYLNDPLSVLPRVVVLGILNEDLRCELQLFRWIIKPLNHHAPVMPLAKHKEQSQGDWSVTTL